jgi:hypothetical protein
MSKNFTLKGKLVGGLAVIKTDPHVARTIAQSAGFDLELKITGHKGKVEYNIGLMAFDTIRVQVVNAEPPIPTNANVVVTIHLVEAGGAPRLLKEELGRPPVPVSTFTINSVGDNFVYDFGWFPPGWSTEMVVPGSLDIHTRLLLNKDLSRQMYLILKGLFEETAAPSPPGWALKSKQDG